MVALIGVVVGGCGCGHVCLCVAAVWWGKEAMAFVTAEREHPHPHHPPPPTATNTQSAGWSPRHEIELCRRPDGSNWVLGVAQYGKVYKALQNGVQVRRRQGSVVECAVERVQQDVSEPPARLGADCQVP